MAKDEIEQRRLVALSLTESAMKRKFFLAHHKDKYISESLQRLMDRSSSGRPKSTAAFKVEPGALQRQDGSGVGDLAGNDVHEVCRWIKGEKWVQGAPRFPG